MRVMLYKPVCAFFFYDNNRMNTIKKLIMIIVIKIPHTKTNPYEGLILNYENEKFGWWG